MPLRVHELEARDGEVPADAIGARPDGPPRTHDRVLVDTFDGRLRAAGITLAAGEPADPSVVGNRRPLPVARVRSTVRDLVVRDARDKVVVRVREERPEVVTEPAHPLAARVLVREVLGYGEAFDAAVRGLEAAGLTPPDEPLFDAVSRAVGRDPRGVSSKPGVVLAPGTPAGAAAGALGSRLADIAELNVPGTLDDLDAEFLHDLRVAVRRARSVLRELKAVFPPDELAHVRAELKWVQAATGPLRDLDVQLEDLDGLTAHLDERRRADLAPLHRLLARRRGRALRELRRTLRGPRFAAALGAWRALGAAPAAEGAALEPVDRLAAERIRSVYHRMVRDGKAIGDGSPAEDLHDLRKRGKELRYLLELFGALFPGDVVKPMVRSLKDLQDVLGRFQDRAVQVELLEAAAEELAGEPGGAAALLALGLVVDGLQRDQAAAREEFYDRFGPFAAKPQRRKVKATFA